MHSEDHNPAFDLAVRYVNQTSRSVFLTGKAGTGKTTFLKFIRDNSFKKMAITAPTGVAAINAGGTTLHSFFQLPFGPYLPVAQPHFTTTADNNNFSDPNSLLRNIRFNSAKRELLRELEVLVIDEISMVRADTLDAVDAILRHFREQPARPFGGLQMLFIGDLFQLPPVVPPAEWELLQRYYASPFFFDAKVIAQSPPACLELKKIYRQNEARFIHLLNSIRTNRVTGEELELLADYFQPDFIPPKADNYITLTSHNAKADAINKQELDKLSGRTFQFDAAVTGEFNDKSYPAEPTLSLKEGAQVMLIKNDKGESRRYYNGKIGVVERLSADRISIRFPDEPDQLTLEKETWRNIRYRYNKEKDRIDEEELGSFSQYPIRLAWAITIHKSQGLTFQKAVIDAGESFAAGQVYVALSRLTSLEGLVLRSRITPWSIRIDARVAAFLENNPPNEIVEQQLEQEQLAYIGSTLLDAFDWTPLIESLDTCCEESVSPRSRHSAGLDLARTWLARAREQQETTGKFIRQISQLLPDAEADSWQRLHQRVEAATSWFTRQLDEQLLGPIAAHLTEIRKRKRMKKQDRSLTALQLVVTRKRQQLLDGLQLVTGLREGVSATRLLDGLAKKRRSREANTPTAVPPFLPGAPRDTSPSALPKGSTRRISLQLHQQGLAIAEIAARRNLAISTIETHLASFIPTGEVNIKVLVPENKIVPILTVIREIGGAALSPLKNRLGDDYSFAEIRAVLQYSKQLPTP